MTAREQQIDNIQNKLRSLTDAAERQHAVRLRRAVMTLHRWYEHECNGVIQRDETTDKPYWYSNVSGERLYAAPDREKGAIKTITSICKELRLHHYLQTDPRGGTLYVDCKEIPDNNYNRATFIA